MEHEHRIAFGPFHFDMTHNRLWRGEDRIALRPRSVAVLRYLLAHAGRLVSQAELRQHVWAQTHVTPTVLRVCIREIRAALQDSALAPQYLETVGQQGYRFLVGDAQERPPLQTTGPILGRHHEVATLEGWFQRATTGERQMVFVSGEAGIGKTTVLGLFRARLAQGAPVRLGEGHCVESYGEGEPYLPLLEALGQLSRGPAGPEVLAALRRYAPMWLVQLPGLLSDTELERVQRQVQGATQARMIRELAQMLDVLTLDTPLVVVLEDLHWSDLSTVECLAALAQRPGPACLLVLGTYRPVETVLRAHPLRGLVQELVGRGQAVDVRLEFLPAEDVAAYVAGRLGPPVAAPLATFVHERTDGNALFMVNLVEHLVQQGLVERRAGQWTLRDDPAVHGLPMGLRQMLLRRIEALAPAARRVLEAASVVGDTFAVAAVAAGLEEAVAAVEAICDGLAAQGHLIADTGLCVWPDGTQGGSYQFRHGLYQQVLYEQVGATRRAQLHGRIGTRLEAGYSVQAAEIAAQLAFHFERGGETAQAVHYWQQAGESARGGHAYPEALTALRKGLTLLATLPESPTRMQDELTLLVSLGELLMAAKGIAAPDVGAVYGQAYRLCHQLGEPPQRFQVLQVLGRFHLNQAQLSTASALAQELTHLAHRQPEAGPVLASQASRGLVAFFRGDFVAARAHLEHYVSCHDAPPLSAPPLPAEDCYRRVTHLAFLGQVLWALGYAAHAQQRRAEALALAQQCGDPASLAYMYLLDALLAQFGRDAATTAAHAETLIAFATAQGLAHRVVNGRLLLGWAVAMQGDAAAGVTPSRKGSTGSNGQGSSCTAPIFSVCSPRHLARRGRRRPG